MAKRFHIIDVPNSRSSHSKPIIRGGGILFYLGFLVFSIHTGFKYPYLFLGVTLLAIVSFLDDIRGLSVGQRIPVQALSVFLVILEIDSPFHWLLIAFLIFAGVLVINCYNFIDGINGMLGIYSITIFLFAGYLCYSEGIFPIDLPVFLLLAILTFGFYNFRKRAVFFSGDIGSMTLGILAFFMVLVLLMDLRAPVLILLLMVCLADTLGTIAKRLLSNKNIFKAHREHIYEQLTDKTKLSHLQIALIYAMVQIIVNTIVLVSYKSAFEIQLGILIIVGIVFSLMYYYVNKRLN